MCIRDSNSPTLEDRFPPVYVDGGSLERVTVRARETDRPHGRLSAWLNASEAYRFVRKKVLTQHPELARFLTRWGLLDRATIPQAPMRDGVPLDYWVFASPWPPDWQDAWRLTEGLLDQFQREVSADGARFGIVVVTSRERLYPETWETIIAANPAMRTITWDLAAPERKVLQWCDAHDVPCLPLSPVFTARREEGPRLHWVYDGHWTAAGHALAARTLADFLRQDHLLPP